MTSPIRPVPSMHRARWLALAAVLLALAGVAAPATAHPAAHPAAAAAHGGWHWKVHKKQLNDLTCPSAQLCVGIQGTDVEVSSDITAAKPKWKAHKLEPASQPDVEGTVQLTSLSCPTARFCATVDSIGNMFYTSNPSAAWSGETIDNGDSSGFSELEKISCASAHLCGAVSYSGQPLSSGDPEGGAGAWHFAAAPQSDYQLVGISCAGASLCVYGTDTNVLDVSTNAAASAPRWHKVHVKGSDWEDVSCPSVHRCVAAGSFTGEHSGLAVSSDPTRIASSAWKLVKIKHDSGFDTVACHSNAFCMVIGDKNVYASHVGPKAAAWHFAHQPTGASMYAMSCPTTKLCVEAGVGGVYVGKR